MLALLTPTRGRPRALAICSDYVQRMGAAVWITIEGDQSGGQIAAMDDGYHIRRYQRSDLSKLMSLADSLREGIHFARILAGNEPLQIAVIEDDDWYAPTYVHWLKKALAESPLVGEGCAVYYNVWSRTYRKIQNTAHASLCSTAWDDGQVGDTINRILYDALSRDGFAEFIDVRLWRAFEGGKVWQPGVRRVVGLKGLPGKRGIGVGHQDQPNADPSMEYLRRLIGDDADRYEKMYRHNAFTD